MFTDARSKKIVFVAHCLLNQNSISDGTATWPGSAKHVVALLLESEVGIVQLPCPELNCLGLDRGNPDGSKSPLLQENSRIRAAMNQEAARAKLTALVAPLVFQVSEYRNFGFQIKGIIGINRSPSCGVETTSRNNREVEGRGVFMEALRRALEENGLPLNMVGIKDSEPERSLLTIRGLLAPRD